MEGTDNLRKRGGLFYQRPFPHLLFFFHLFTHNLISWVEKQGDLGSSEEGEKPSMKGLGFFFGGG